jgi:hypothetical protein
MDRIDPRLVPTRAGLSKFGTAIVTQSRRETMEAHDAFTDGNYRAGIPCAYGVQEEMHMPRTHRAVRENGDAITLKETGVDSISPDSDRIALRAYERYQARGGGDGHHLEDWLEAERELRQDASRSTTVGPGPSNAE